MKDKNHVITSHNVEQEVQKLVRSDVVIHNKLDNDETCQGLRHWRLLYNLKNNFSKPVRNDMGRHPEGDNPKDLQTLGNRFFAFAQNDGTLKFGDNKILKQVQHDKVVIIQNDTTTCAPLAGEPKSLISKGGKNVLDYKQAPFPEFVSKVELSQKHSDKNRLDCFAFARNDVINKTVKNLFPYFPISLSLKKKFAFTLAEGATHVGLPPTKVKFAFTLAEVLITLGIIGIVAAMTIPTLMSKYQEKTYKTQYKKIYSELNQAIKSLEGDEMLPVQVCNSYDDSCLRDLFANKMKFLHKCRASAPNDCQAKSIFLDGNRNNGGVWVNASWPSFVTLSGYSIKFRFHLNDCMSTDEIYKNGELKTCGWVQVDTNGLSGPNTVGKDIFFLAMMSDGFIPFYQEENNKAQDCYHGTGVSCSALYINENSGMIFNSAMGG